MRAETVRTIARREYLARVTTKGFWIATVTLPLLMAAMVFLPSLVLLKAKATHRMAVVDETGELGAALVEALAPEPGPRREARDLEALGERQTEEQTARFVVELVAPGEPEAQRAALDARVLAGEIDSWIRLGAGQLAGGKVEYRAASVSNFLTQKRLEGALSRVVSRARLEGAGLDAARVSELTRATELDTVRVSERGSRAEGGMAGFFLAYFLFFLLYMVVAIYGQQVLNGVLEEKTTRVVEVLLATVRPVELMLGKLAGIGLVGLTQLGIWLATAVALTAPGVVGAMAWLPEGKMPQVAPGVVVHFLLLFLLGYFFFATLYAAIGAASNNLQEAQQFAGVVVIFLVAPVLLMMPVINDPDSVLAVVVSLIPPFTPLLMMLRIAVKMPPAWQVALGYLLSGGFTLLLVWLCARIYRVGILMHGKKPSLAELWRWLRYA
ncbi:MAG: ABC transporter permease [Thermoanaerobaculia bacterium]|nr:ABC transporter permease [Thermoanaerobaculia bacterium]